MNKTIKSWSIRLISFGFISFLTIVLTVFNPHLLYANKTVIGNYTIYHNAGLTPEFESRLANVNALIKESELYDDALELKICLNDGSIYPSLMKKLRGPAFGWGFQNIVSFQGAFDYKENTVELNGYKWNLEQLIAHELTHCLQFNELGLLHSNPLGNHPDWKWEGYAEYVSRKNEKQLFLAKNMERIELAIKENPNAWGVFFDDETISPRAYYDSWLLVQYCLDIKGMSYIELLNSDIPKASIEEEMNEWYRNNLKDMN
ncbi:MAG: hypothetical protein MI974_09265 [Chitinophagales bacterium]|nr:hypothetical protein [Chitinophagales bacterium]